MVRRRTDLTRLKRSVVWGKSLTAPAHTGRVTGVARQDLGSGDAEPLSELEESIWRRRQHTKVTVESWNTVFRRSGGIGECGGLNFKERWLHC